MIMFIMWILFSVTAKIEDMCGSEDATIAFEDYSDDEEDDDIDDVSYITWLNVNGC